jgi:ethanolamine utilization cobalamin adenosyltransferase
MIITEYELRANWHKDKPSVITVPRGSVITPAARDFLRDKQIRVQIEGDGMMDLNRINYSNTRHSLINSQESGGWTNHMRPVTPQAPPITEPQPAVPEALTAAVRQAAPEASIAAVQRAVQQVLAAMQHDAQQAPSITGQQEPPHVPSIAAQQEPPQAAKPEHMTHLYGSTLAVKNHPAIALRGQLDLFQCELMETQLWLQSQGEQEFVDQLEDVAAFARQLMVAEVRREPFEITTLIGYSADELREVSHYPQKYLGVKHTHLSIAQGPVAIKLHRLRAKAREVELYAIEAFTDQVGNCSRTDIITALNRLSSAFYIMACKARAKFESQSNSVFSGV